MRAASSVKRHEDPPKRKMLDVDRGLFLVRYVSADDGQYPPSVRVALEGSARGSGAIIAHPDADDAILHQPGSALVVRTLEPAQLVIEVSPLEKRGSTAAVVNVEALALRDTAASSLPRPAPRDDETGEIEILGHVAGIGDVTVKAGEWVAGPDAPSRIEGIAIAWRNKPADIDLRYAVSGARGAGRLVDLDTFAGSRGRGAPITGLTIELSGRAAQDQQLSVQALFLGSPTARATGKRVNLRGITGREPLVGIRLSIEPVGSSELAPPRKVQRAGEVRVFRSRSRQQEASA